MRSPRSPRAPSLSSPAGSPRSFPFQVPPPEPEKPKKPPPPPPTKSEYKVAYAMIIFTLSSIITAICGLSIIAWKVDEGSWNSFGVRYVHIYGATHELKTVTLDNRVYKASDGALAFTILGIFMSSFTLLSLYKYVSKHRKTLKSLLILSLICAILYLFAIMLYATIFPQRPYVGNIEYYYGNVSSTDTIGTFSHAHFSPLQQQQQPRSSQSQLQAAHSPSHSSACEYWHGMHDDVGGGGGDLQTCAPPPRSSMHVLEDVVFPTPPPSDVPTFPTPDTSGGGTDTPDYSSGTDNVTATASQSAAQIAYQTRGVLWSLGTSYWLVLSSALTALFFPFCALVYTGVMKLYELHKEVGMHEKRYLVPFALLCCAFLLALIGLGTKEWKVDANTGTIMGLDELDYNHLTYKVRNFWFSSKAQRVQDVSQAALAFGVLGVFPAFITCCLVLMLVYDPMRSLLSPLFTCALTCLCWFITLVVYGERFPQWVGSIYFEFGFSYWLFLTATCLYFLPLFAGVVYVSAMWLWHRTLEEKLMMIPTFCSLCSWVWAIAALSTRWWCHIQNDNNNHLGLLIGRYDGNIIMYDDFPIIHKLVAPVSMGTLILVICGVGLQTPGWLLGALYVAGWHEVCRSQMSLVNTILSITSFVLYLLGIIYYAVFLPWSSMPSYEFGHSWILLVCSCVITSVAVVGFALLAVPPQPQTENQYKENKLAAAL